MLTTIERPGASESPLLFREHQFQGSDATITGPAGELDNTAEKAVLCRACRAVVTGLKQQVAIDGRHQHAFFNPAGIIYEIRCFAKASGCIKHGPPTPEFTWFKGYAWQYAVCATCFDHLGWFYASAGSSFFGLIEVKLVVE